LKVTDKPGSENGKGITCGEKFETNKELRHKRRSRLRFRKKRARKSQKRCGGSKMRYQSPGTKILT